MNEEVDIMPLGRRTTKQEMEDLKRILSPESMLSAIVNRLKHEQATSIIDELESSTGIQIRRLYPVEVSSKRILLDIFKEILSR